MSAQQFTEGPWRYTIEPQPNGCPIVGARGLMVCMLAHSVHEPDQRETAIANASLIAAAPDLYAIADRLGKLADGLANSNSGAEDAAADLADDARALVRKINGGA